MADKRLGSVAAEEHHWRSADRETEVCTSDYWRTEGCTPRTEKCAPTQKSVHPIGRVYTPHRGE